MWIHHQSVHIGTSIVACNYHSPHDHHGCSGCGLIKTRWGIVCSAIKNNICICICFGICICICTCICIWYDHHRCSGCGLIKTRQGIVCSAIKDNICSLLVQDPSLSASSCLPIFDFFYFACVFMFVFVFVFSSFPPCIMLLNIQKPFENNSKVNSQMR